MRKGEKLTLENSEELVHETEQPQFPSTLHFTSERMLSPLSAFVYSLDLKSAVENHSWARKVTWGQWPRVD